MVGGAHPTVVVRRVGCAHQELTPDALVGGAHPTVPAKPLATNVPAVRSGKGEGGAVCGKPHSRATGA
jgi:hypothetical protein